MFDRFVVVDWSANSTPKRGRDSIWIAVYHNGGIELSNPSTRSEASDLLSDLVRCGTSTRTLIGVDFSLGYPAGTSAALGITGPPWRAMVDHLTELVVESDRNANNRFAVAAQLNARMTGSPSPFWGCPPLAATATLTSTKPRAGSPVADWRQVELSLMALGHRPFSSWQLLGAGAVGSQSLVGIPTIERLRRRFEGRVQVWPLSTGLQAPRVAVGDVVVAEVWPSMLPVEPIGDEVHDAAQVHTVAAWLAALDLAGDLQALFDPPVADDVRESVEREEGWVLGVAPSWQP